MVTRKAHNLKTVLACAGSNPAPATIQGNLQQV